MNMTEHPLGFWVLGPATGTRWPVDWAAAFRAYAECDPKAKCEKEAYLSAFTFGPDFAEYVEKTGGAGRYNGSCYGPYIWLDLDRDQLDTALVDARRLAVATVDMLELNEDDLLVFFSGGKGFHFGVPTTLWTPQPGTLFHQTARQFAQAVATKASVIIDTGIYDKVRLFRAPNSRHHKGLYKRHLTLDQLLHMRLDAILKLAEHPEPFELPTPTVTSTIAGRIWAEAVERAKAEAAGMTARIQIEGQHERLTRSALDFIQNGACIERHHRLLVAATNLKRAGAPLQLCKDLLTEPALDSGIRPKEAQRTIENGWARAQPEVNDVCEILQAEVVGVEQDDGKEGGQ